MSWIPLEDFDTNTLTLKVSDKKKVNYEIGVIGDQPMCVKIDSHMVVPSSLNFGEKWVLKYEVRLHNSHPKHEVYMKKMEEINKKCRELMLTLPKPGGISQKVFEANVEEFSLYQLNSSDGKDYPPSITCKPYEKYGVMSVECFDVNENSIPYDDVIKLGEEIKMKHGLYRRGQPFVANIFFQPFTISDAFNVKNRMLFIQKSEESKFKNPFSKSSETKSPFHTMSTTTGKSISALSVEERMVKLAKDHKQGPRGVKRKASDNLDYDKTAKKVKTTA